MEGMSQYEKTLPLTFLPDLALAYKIKAPFEGGCKNRYQNLKISYFIFQEETPIPPALTTCLFLLHAFR